MFSVFEPDPLALTVMAGTADYHEEHLARRREQRGEIERLFLAELKRADIQGKWIETSNPAPYAVPHAARAADLVIAGQDDPTDPESYVGDAFPQTLVLTSGRPVLLVPHAGHFSNIGKYPLIAWDGSREAARAVHDALPLLKTAEQVNIVRVSTDRQHVAEVEPEMQIVASLALHGIQADVSVVRGTNEATAGEALLSCVADVSADLLVMGGYGHSRWREIVLGGATQTILSSTTVPVLMSH
jgi:nucleotide-binding universal stress UspA family protein